MKVFLFSVKKTAAFTGDKKTAALTRVLPAAALSRHSPEAGDISYLDISGLPPEDLKKALARLKKSCRHSSWGILDPKGEAPDPAEFFFAGAADYIGPKALKGNIGKKRFAAALAWREAGSHESAAGTAAAPEADTLCGLADGRNGRKLPGGKFEGWHTIRAGTTAPFFFLFVSLSGKTNLRSRLGESSFVAVKNRLRDMLQQNLQDSQALLWMETESNCLFLIPPRAANGKAAVEASLKMIMGSPLISIEKLGLPIPVDFTFALHYGQTIFRAPGKTGTVVSDAVNYIFHLGVKHADPGRLTISTAVSDEAIPEGLAGLFVNAGMFEGFPIRHSRRFKYSG
ncbi:MAG: hypothetical protein LBE14_07075 [Treponema sp.]|jgi:hypothetical protein|nr:hypothetical protein [Treponema sp.]